MTDNPTFPRAMFRGLLKKWIARIQDPTGFPDEPAPDRCWVWTGYSVPPRTVSFMSATKPDAPMRRRTYHKPDPQPRVTFLKKSTAPHRVMLWYHLGVPLDRIGRTTNTCGNPLCINPLHYVKTGEVNMNTARVMPDDNYEATMQPEPEPEPEQEAEIDRAFRLFWNEGFTLQHTAEYARKRINPDWVDAYFDDYLSFIHGKDKAEICAALNV